MKPIISLINAEQLEALSSRSNFRYGKKIAEDGTINFTKTNTFNFIADVTYKNGEHTTVELMSTSKGFRWKCSCTAKKDLFCKHCVAAGFKALTPTEQMNEQLEE